MAVIRSITSLPLAILFLSYFNPATATIYLSPPDDILSPASESATEPLKWLGANSPYFAGPDVNGVSNEVPKSCHVEQVAYLVRHGSRYPDSGAYAQWVALYDKIQAASFTSRESLKFLKEWKPVLTNPAAQIAQESPTGYKEAYDLGYKLRTKYSDLYAYGTPFMSWANLYPRVVQTAQNFVRGFLGSTASHLGTVYTVNSTGSADALFDSLSPSDQCPLFADGNGGTEATKWNALYLPPILARLNQMISGNLNFTTTDVSIMPYLCGYESQITGTLSPWCSVFTDHELKQYEYAQDLRYYYGTGPGTNLPSKMMLPFLNSLIGIMAKGPGTTGRYPNGTSYTLPDIITAFMNDGQMTELGAAIGVWDGTTNLTGDAMLKDYKYIASHFVSMRGTVAFERLNCAVSHSAGVGARGADYGVKTLTRTKKTTVCPTSTSNISKTLTPVVSGSASTSSRHSNSSPSAGSQSVTSLVSGSSTSSSKHSNSSSSALSNSSTTVLSSSPTISSRHSSTSTTSSSISQPTPPSTNNQTYIRILLNDAVYPVPSCRSGPGSSCPVDEYAAFIQGRLQAAGDLRTRCNVTNKAAPTVLKGASFFTNLGASWVGSVVP